MPAKKNQSPEKSAAPSVIALDLGGTKLAGAILSAKGALSHKVILRLEKRRGKRVGVLISDQIKTFRKIAEAEGIKIEAIGICVPGVSHQETGRVWAPNIPGWENYPLRREILSALGTKRIRVEIESDRTCCLLGETWRGAARGCKHAIFLAVGTGIGAGILVDGRILRGANDIAGAIGWLALARPFYEQYAGCGCFESRASGEGIAKMARQFLRETPGYHGILKKKKSVRPTAHDVFAAYQKRDPIAVRVLQEAVEFWGMATANLVSLFNPEKIIFGGGVFGPGLQFLDAVRAEAKKWAQPLSMDKVKFEGSRLSGHAGLYGAGYLALSSLPN